MDERILLRGRTGVGAYARGLRAAIREIAGDVTLIADRADPLGRPPAPLGRVGRVARALLPLTICARPAIPNEEQDERYFGTDLFRLSQVHFDIWGRPLSISVPGPPGIAHWSYPLPIRVEGWRNIYTVHDVIPLTAPTLTPINAGRHRRLLKALGRGAAAFVTVSGTAKREIEAALGADAPLTVDCGQAVSASRSPASSLPEPLTHRGYLLVAGTVERRKNIAAIIAAYKASRVLLPLVIAGPDGWEASEVESLLDDPSIIRLPYLPTETMRCLIANARALLMVSLAEGFGLPIAEALADGTPVITSNRGAQAETAAAAGLLVDPSDVFEISAAITRISTNDICWSTLSYMGRARSETFTPETFSSRLSALYRDLV
ncbi:glycosyltransferase involved in cell wall biosynthesis [Sphingomonas vulcanisoli]|uniref:Glycosyltransferase involved in cell wall biosynthesis n=1 Tax=Sphingomonas vulcanisoli TaxID=1658060 RepID=A0ABX0TVA2_9SPHN|nr:glycosyltransferase family 1 protein [Sphingomonas vulcanisoli]NIJ09466.1 glycosyltransferase involved in cell wall biosynthesis [Sphingomonas vulcanisoli]